MKIFLDTANLSDIKKWVERGVLDGVTTNPTLLGVEDCDAHNLVLEICEVVSGDVNVEVLEQDQVAMLDEARSIAGLASNVVVKIPFSVDNLSTIKQLVSEGIRVNVTLVFSLAQALLAFKAGVTYISPFLGRWEDAGGDGTDFLSGFVDLKHNFGFETQVLAASIRTVAHLDMAMLVGADIVTLPSKILKTATNHILTEKGIKQFSDDWKRARKSLLSH